MNINIIILFIVIILFLILISNKTSENYTQCQKKNYIDPQSTEHCYLRCSNDYKPFGNRCSDVFSTFFPS